MALKIRYADEPMLDLFVRHDQTLTDDLADVDVFRIIRSQAQAVRLANVLESPGKVRTLGDLLAKGRVNVLRINGMGPKLMHVLDEVLKGMALDWLWLRRPILVMPRGGPAAAAMSTPTLKMWVIYRPITRDYPDRWVARLFVLDEHGLYAPPSSHRIRRGTFYVERTRDAIRARLPQGLVCLARSPDDDPVIEEVWL